MIQSVHFASPVATAADSVCHHLHDQLGRALAAREQTPDDDSHEPEYRRAQDAIGHLVEQIAARPALTSEALSMKIRLLAGLSQDVGTTLAIDACEEMQRAAHYFQKLAWSIIGDLALSVEPGSERESFHE